MTPNTAEFDRAQGHETLFDSAPRGERLPRDIDPPASGHKRQHARTHRDGDDPADGHGRLGRQRCFGNETWTSTYGTAGTGKTGTTFTGMGPAGTQIQAPANKQVMFVELAYDYDPVVEPFAQGLQYFGLRVDNQVLTYKQAFIVRDPRTPGNSTITARTAAEDFGLFQNTPAVTRRDC